MMGIDQTVSEKADAYRSNPQALAQRYQQNQELMDLLALQKITSEKKAAQQELELAAQNNPATIAQQREQEYMAMTKQDMARQTGQIAQKQMQDKQKAVNTVADKMSGVASLPTQTMQMAGGGIVSFKDGGLAQRQRRPSIRREPKPLVTGAQITAEIDRLLALPENEGKTSSDVHAQAVANLEANTPTQPTPTPAAQPPTATTTAGTPAVDPQEDFEAPAAAPAPSGPTQGEVQQNAGLMSSTKAQTTQPLGLAGLADEFEKSQTAVGAYAPETTTAVKNRMELDPAAAGSTAQGRTTKAYGDAGIAELEAEATQLQRDNLASITDAKRNSGAAFRSAMAGAAGKTNLGSLGAGIATGYDNELRRQRNEKTQGIASLTDQLGANVTGKTARTDRGLDAYAGAEASTNASIDGALQAAATLESTALDSKSKMYSTLANIIGQQEIESLRANVEELKLAAESSNVNSDNLRKLQFQIRDAKTKVVQEFLADSRSAMDLAALYQALRKPDITEAEAARLNEQIDALEGALTTEQQKLTQSLDEMDTEVSALLGSSMTGSVIGAAIPDPK